MAKSGWRLLLAGLVSASLFFAHAAMAAEAKDGGPAVQAEAKRELSGSITGVSKKARLITMDVDQSVQTVRFDEATAGLEHAVVGEAAVVEYRLEGGERVATTVKQRLAKLPAGVTGITVDEMAQLVDRGPEKGNYFLVDSRPEARYHEGHVPTAVSIPVPKLEKAGAALFPPQAKEKKTALIFYCGGVT